MVWVRKWVLPGGLEGEGVETAGSGNLIGCAETGLTGFDGLTLGADKPKRSGC